MKTKPTQTRLVIALAAGFITCVLVSRSATADPAPQTVNTVAAPIAVQPVAASGPGFGPNGPPSTLSDTMPGIDMSSNKNAGMKMTGDTMPGIDMKPLKMPQLQEQGTYIATGRENWKIRTGFGKNTGIVAMMSQMMVGGSGMEGMKMPAMKMSFDETNFTEEPGDAETDSSPSTSSAMTGMTGMQITSPTSSATPTKPIRGVDAGHTDSPPVQTPTAVTQTPTSAPQPATSDLRGSTGGSMAGMKMPFKITGAIGSPKSGDNALSITITDAVGALITGAKITTSVAMTSMDMGTSHPPVKEVGSGKYQSTVNFSMSGPWRVILIVTPPGGGPAQKKTFDFNAK